jgi:hypothetical protein
MSGAPAPCPVTSWPYHLVGVMTLSAGRATIWYKSMS